MKRYLCCVALLGVVALPDWAAACWLRCGPRVCGGRMYRPVCAPPPVYVCPSATGYALPPPRVESVPKMATPAPASGLGTSTPGTVPAAAPLHPPTVESIRTPLGSDTPVSPMTPPKQPDPPASNFPTVAIPKGLEPLPKLELPGDPDFRPVSKESAPKLPALPNPGGTAVPTPAPALPEPAIPLPTLPVVPEPSRPDALPSLTLPPDGPIARPKSDSTSRSSPLTGSGKPELAVSVFPVADEVGRTGVVTTPGAGYRTVGFYNHTDRDVVLTIEGRVVKLPAKSYLHARLASTFTWSPGDRPATRETVPAGASGFDVVLR